MSDEYIPRRKIFKKKRKFEGQNWDQSETIAELEKAKQKGRVYCKTCRKFKPWSSLYPKYERGGKHKIDQVWYCKDCGAGLHTKHIDLRKKS